MEKLIQSYSSFTKTMFGLTVALILISTSTIASAQQWKQPRLLVTKDSIGPIRLGQQLSPQVYEVLGKPDQVSDSVVFWGPQGNHREQGIEVRLEDGKVYNISAQIGVRAYMDQGLYIGCSWGKVKSTYPNGESQRGMYVNWQTPDFYFSTFNGAVLGRITVGSMAPPSFKMPE